MGVEKSPIQFILFRISFYLTVSFFCGIACAAENTGNYTLSPENQYLLDSFINCVTSNSSAYDLSPYHPNNVIVISRLDDEPLDFSDQDNLIERCVERWIANTSLNIGFGMVNSEHFIRISDVIAGHPTNVPEDSSSNQSRDSGPHPHILRASTSIGVTAHSDANCGGRITRHLLSTVVLLKQHLSQPKSLNPKAVFQRCTKPHTIALIYKPAYVVKGYPIRYYKIIVNLSLLKFAAIGPISYLHITSKSSSSRF